ncbi:hypothetical protein L207DRAFT_567618 [Hyaloscypha variabilis F]|uniref:Uncharacterized protein n=1 Tax=Hyaloscypha variabilis (strain UAMH 11265 / GT02V1 / F) TaxID=1149755 RepID=A0A2J6RLG3_HYAVF|nr:hypothetical protein L207DRAFT_567618 [Hyaloscypha variabilis F]
MLLQAHGSASSQMKPAPSHWLATNKAALAAVVPGSRALKWKRLSLYLRSAILAAKKSREPRSAGGDFSDENSASRGQKSSSGDLAGRAITACWVVLDVVMRSRGDRRHVCKHQGPPPRPCSAPRKQGKPDEKAHHLWWEVVPSSVTTRLRAIKTLSSAKTEHTHAKARKSSLS